jgi:uncharacterized protein
MATSKTPTSKAPTADFLGLGWAFPIAVAGGRFAVKRDDELIRQSILLILQTSKGERVMEPNFGCDLKQMVFSPNNDSAFHLAAYAVREALQQWEPRIRVLDVSAQSGSANPNWLNISIDYLIRSFNSRHNLVYPFYLG